MRWCTAAIAVLAITGYNGGDQHAHRGQGSAFMERSTEGSAAVTAPPEAQSDRTRFETPGIIAPGPWIAFAALGIGLLFDVFHVFYDSFRVIAHIPSVPRKVTAVLVMALGGWIVIRANVIFHRAGTPFQPWRPTRSLAAQDIYARTRNPMYQGFLVLVFGLAILLRSDWGALMLIPAALLIHYGVVLREERYLVRKFGDSYRQYMAAVPRYGWPFPALFQRRSKP